MVAGMVAAFIGISGDRASFSPAGPRTTTTDMAAATSAGWFRPPGVLAGGWSTSATDRKRPSDPCVEPPIRSTRNGGRTPLLKHALFANRCPLRYRAAALFMKFWPQAGQSAVQGKQIAPP